MTANGIIAELEASLPVSPAVLNAAVAQAEELAPVAVALIDEAAGGASLLPQQERLLFRSLPILAAARQKALYRPLLRLLRTRTPDELERLLGDGVTEFVPQVILSVFDGDAAALIAAIEDRSVGGLERWGLLQVLARLVFDGEVPRKLAAALLDRFDREGLAADGDPAWCGWEEAIALLGLTEMSDRVHASWVSGRNPQRDAEQGEWESLLAEACAAPDDPARFDRSMTPIDDPAETLEWFEMVLAGDEGELSDEELAEAFAADAADRADPAADTALTREEQGWLADFLGSAAVPRTTMSLEELDGFFTGLIVGPESVPAEDFGPEIWGTPDGTEPDFSDEQLERLMGLLTRHWRTIGSRLAEGYPHIPLISDPGEGWERGELWVRGFRRGVGLCKDAWARGEESDVYATLISAIVLLDPELRQSLAEQGEELPERRRLLQLLPMTIIGLYEFWIERSEAGPREPVAPPKRWGDKTGRNAPCPCGSGRKYKRCCGA